MKKLFFFFSIIFLSSCVKEDKGFWGTTPRDEKTYNFLPKGDSLGYLSYLNPDGWTDKRYLEIFLHVAKQEEYPKKTALLALKKIDGTFKNITCTSSDVIIRNYVKYLFFSPANKDTLFLYLFDGINKPYPDIWADPPDKKLILEL